MQKLRTFAAIPFDNKKQTFSFFVALQLQENPLPIASLHRHHADIYTPASTATPPRSINTAAPRVWII